MKLEIEQTVRQFRRTDGGWKMEDGTDGRWKMEDGRWKKTEAHLKTETDTRWFCCCVL